jgi:hypothetical protein
LAAQQVGVNVADQYALRDGLAQIAAADIEHHPGPPEK